MCMCYLRICEISYVGREKHADVDSDAILSEKGAITIKNSDVQAIGGKTSRKDSKWKSAGLHSKKGCKITNSTVYSRSQGKKNAYGIFSEKKAAIISRTGNVTAYGKVAFNKKPTFSHCKAVVRAGKSGGSAKKISKPNKNSYIKNKYVNVKTVRK